ncbi:MAG: nuclear transport factor 2 family protein [Gammaproteobacteria bacterium]|nr:nuclear transport factor 2 family protein [Gammaproteobacteria bacterium]
MDWVRKFFATADSLDAAAVASLLKEDVELHFGNGDLIKGRAAVESTFAGFYESIAGMSHNVIELWETGSGAVAESAVTYTRIDDREVTVPVASVFEYSDGAISHLRISVDLAPLYA